MVTVCRPSSALGECVCECMMRTNEPWIVHHLYCSVSLINLQYKMISCPGHKITSQLASSSIWAFILKGKSRKLKSEAHKRRDILWKNKKVRIALKSIFLPVTHTHSPLYTVTELSLTSRRLFPRLFRGVHVILTASHCPARWTPALKGPRLISILWWHLGGPDGVQGGLIRS